MTLENIYFITQIIAATAVVVSLLYVGVQLNQNTRAVHPAVSRKLVERIPPFGNIRVLIQRRFAQLFIEPRDE